MIDLDTDQTTAMSDNGVHVVQLDEPVAPGFEQALVELRAAQRPIVVTHENPDGASVQRLVASVEDLRG